MTDAANVLSILDYVTAAGEPVSGGSIEFYQAGTSTARTVYSDAALTVSLGTIVYTDSEGFPVSTQGGSTRVSIYTGTGAYKVIVKNSSGTTLFTRDNIPGALDTSGFDTTSALPTIPVSAKTAAYTITTSDRGYLFNANPTGGTFVMTLPSAVTAGDNFTVGIRHNGTANQVTLAAVSSQNIRGPGTPTSYFSLVGRGEEVWLASDGADWIVTSYVPALIRPGVIPPVLHITDRLTVAPSSPTAGARYIVNGSPTGTWSTLGFAQHDIAEADGNGSWIKYTPANGWLAYVSDETLYTAFYASAWNDQSGMAAAQSSVLGYAVFADQKADGTVGGSATTGAWTKRTINTTLANTITGCSLASSVITLTTGSYLVWASAYQQRTNAAGISILQGASTRWYGLPGNTSTDGAHLSVFTPIVVSGASDTIELDYYAQSNSTTSDLGVVLPLSGNTETYAIITILSLSSLQGATGAQGAQGTDGLDAAYPYQWSTSTSGDPGSGKIAGNNATIASITQLQISETDSAGGSMAAVIATWDDSTSTNRATVKISKEGATQNFHSFRITGAGTDAGTYWTFPVTYIATSGTISNADSCAVLVIEKGDKGDTGATGSAGVYSFDYTFSTTTTSGPSTGTIRANNATLSSATALYIHETDRLGVSQAAAIAQWDDSTTTVKGYLTLVDLTTPANRVRFSITGANVDNGSDDTITVTYVSGVTSLTAVNVAVLFERVGDKGADGAGSGDFFGPASSTDNAIVRFDSTTGKLGQNSTVTVSDAGTIAGVAAITLAANDGGALGASGTAFSDLFLASGGAIDWAGGGIAITEVTDYLSFSGGQGYAFDNTVYPAVNDGGALGLAANGWSDLFLASGAVVNWNASNVTLTHSAATLTLAGATSLAMGTSIAVGLGTIELGHASDTTLSRSSAGVMAVEGETVHTNSIARTVSALAIELGHATDTSIARSSAGNISIEGNVVYRAGGTDVPVADGGTGLSSGTSGGIPYFSSGTAIASSAALTANALVKGGGAGAAPVSSDVSDNGAGVVTLTKSQNATTKYAISNTDVGASASATLSGTSDAGSFLFQVVSTAAGGFAQFQSSVAGGIYFDANNAAGQLIVRTGSGFGEGLRVDSSQAVKFAGITTTASAANAFLDSGASNSILRSTSSRRYKTDIEVLSSDLADKILTLEPVWYRSASTADRKDWSWYGLIAEDVAAVEPRLVHWGIAEEDYETVATGVTVDGQITTERRVKVGAVKVPDGVQYERLSVLLLDVVRRLRDRVDALEKKISVQ